MSILESYYKRYLYSLGNVPEAKATLHQAQTSIVDSEAKE